MNQFYLYTKALILMGLILLGSCGEADKSYTEVVLPVEEMKEDSIRLIKVSDSTGKTKPSRLNYTDENGLKQGKWEERGWKNAVVDIKNYVNDTLHGPWYTRHGMSISGNYKKGKKDGYEWHYYDNYADTNMMSLVFYENNEALWFAHPMADQGLLMHVKGLIMNVDSAYVKAPFSDGTLWYEGLYILKEPVDEHIFYYPNGVLHGKVDYSKETFIEFDSIGVLLREGDLKDITCIKRFGLGSNYQ